MNTKKKTVLVAAFIVAILALAGIGYATAFSDSYKGTTKTETSTYDVDWVRITPGTDAFTPKTTGLYVVYDTVTTYAAGNYVYTYYWLGSTSVSHDVAIEIPNDYGNVEDRDTFTITATVDTTTNAIPTGYKLQYKVGTEDWQTYSSSATLASNITSSAVDTWITGVEVSWRYVPSQDNIGNVDDGGASGIAVTANIGTAVTDNSLTLGAITYTVTATQKVTA